MAIFAGVESVWEEESLGFGVVLAVGGEVGREVGCGLVVGIGWRKLVEAEKKRVANVVE
jgi:hypothetical protein